MGKTIVPVKFWHGKSPFERMWHIWEDNIKIYLRDVGYDKR
jgi:hypothetical protein